MRGGLSVVCDMDATITQQKGPGKTGAFEIAGNQTDQRE